MSINVTEIDRRLARQVRQLLLAVLAVPVGPLEHAVQLAHETDDDPYEAPPETFSNEGLTRQALRMFWHFRCNLEAVMPPEGHG
ncbi:MAG TPA: hypothetical protein PKG77_23280 [Phycisphaerae bacterium]|nr:hypothetical protein [Phycisphaerae bacterium]HQL76148.1 hypothetical protein [Phycisphaerae bacterium]